ncbi:DNA polymerase III subunit gamma/tau [Pararhodospirillum photometricum]|nr:DNA polymerase III subunit gamma/tau [Pararhodospirillum photometricum]
MTDTSLDESTALEHPGAYRVLARKYRPTTFDALIGQDALVQTLTNAIQSGRLAQAWMLTGVRGVGKTTTARLIARALNCVGPDGTGGVTIAPCGVCEHCRAIAEDRHVDVLEMDAASRTGVNDIREILDGVRYRPAMARTKVYIIDEVHMLSTAAFNALLKTLEEPPAHVKFIFATTELRKVPVTVLSRCQRFDLRRVGVEQLTTHFARLAGIEGASIEAGALALIARAADGSVRDGLSLLDQAIAHTAGVVSEAQVAEMLGLADRAQVLDLLEHLLAGRIAPALEGLARHYALGADPLVVLQDLLDLIHWMTRVKVVPASTDDAAVPEAERERAAGMAGRLSMAVLNRAWQILLKGLDDARTAPVPLRAVEMALIRLAYSADLPTPDEALRRLAASGPSAGTAPAPGGGGGGGGARALGGGAAARLVASQAVAPAPVAAVSGTAVDAVPKTFARLVDLVRSKREVVLAAHLSRDVRLVRYDPEACVLEFHPLPQAPRTLAGQVGTLLTRWTGRRWGISVSDQPGQATLHDTTTADIHAHPLIQALLHAFPGAALGTIRTTRAPEEDEDEAVTYEAPVGSADHDAFDPFTTEDDS